MHELAITEAIIDLINRQSREKGFSKVLGISLRGGEYSGIIPECLREFFPIAAKGGIAQEAELEIISLPAAFRCLGCGYQGEVDRKEASCPRCKSREIRMVSGREFYVESLKVE